MERYEALACRPSFWRLASGPIRPRDGRRSAILDRIGLRSQSPVSWDSRPGFLLPPAPRPQGLRFAPRVSDGPRRRNRAWHPLVRRSSPRLWNETHFARLVEPLGGSRRPLSVARAAVHLVNLVHY